MKKWPVLVVCAFLVLASVGSSPPELQEGIPPADLKPTVDGNSAFALELFAQLKDADGNLCFSPYSISSALAIAYGGARGNTEKQMATALHILVDQEMFHSAMAKIRRTFSKIDDRRRIELTVANGLWTQQGYSFIPGFLDFAKKRYGAVIDSVDFRTAHEPVRKQINRWIERQTKQRIANALPSGMLSSDTRLVIVNAIYFKGDWASRFDTKQTEQESFWITPEKTITAPMMHQEHVFRYAEQEELQILELPYIGHDLSMLILLPKKRDGLLELQQHLNGDNVAKWIKALGVWIVDVRFPKFTTGSRFSLPPTLSAMGMSDAFTESQADFSGMTPQRPLFITAVEHAALVEVDEQGTVAAATTSISIGCARSVQPLSATFRADHPFVYLIRDNHTGTILFVGRVVDPTK